MRAVLIENGLTNIINVYFSNALRGLFHWRNQDFVLRGPENRSRRRRRRAGRGMGRGPKTDFGTF